jgi:isocitrate dehydrogenase
MQGGVDYEAKRRARLQAIEDERRQREAQRAERPYTEMEASGRQPLTVGEIMSPVRAVPGDTTVGRAMRYMREQGISSVLVEPCGRDGWAIMTQRDVVKRIVLGQRSPAQVKVAEIASRPLVMLPPGTSLFDCGQKMLAANVRRVVVGEGEQPIGIVSDTDIFRLIDRFGWNPE